MNIQNLIEAKEKLFLFWCVGITHWPLYISKSTSVLYYFIQLLNLFKAIKPYEQNVKTESDYKTRNISFNYYLRPKKIKLSDSTPTSYSPPHTLKSHISWNLHVRCWPPTFHHEQAVGEVDEQKKRIN